MHFCCGNIVCAFSWELNFLRVQLTIYTCTEIQFVIAGYLSIINVIIITIITHYR